MESKSKELHGAAKTVLGGAVSTGNFLIESAFAHANQAVLLAGGEDDEALNDAFSVCAQMIAVQQIAFINLLLRRAGVATIGDARRLMERNVGATLDNAIAETIMAARQNSEAGNV